MYVKRGCVRWSKKSSSGDSQSLKSLKRETVKLKSLLLSTDNAYHIFRKEKETKKVFKEEEMYCS